MTPHCSIVIRERLDRRWAGEFEGLRVVPRDDGTTLLTGPVQDGSALWGHLRRLEALGLTLISVERFGGEAVRDAPGGWGRGVLPLLAWALLAAVPTPAAAQETALDGYVRAGLEANLQLRRQALAEDQAEARLSEARSAWLPSLEVTARYSRAGGGRTSEIPVGDLMNPVYSTLDELTALHGFPGGFPTVENQSIDFIRPEEQETRLRVTQLLWSPDARADVRRRRALASSAEAGTEAARRGLVRDIRIAYYRYANAARAVEILDAALELVRENERSASALHRAALATPDRVHRARAERLETEEDRARAVADREDAASYLNFLLDRPAGAPLEVDPADLRLPEGGPLGGLRRVAAPGDGAVSVDAPLPWVDSLARAAAARRPELRRLDHAVDAASAGLDAVRGATRPSLVLALDAGLQGARYDLTRESAFLMASVVLSWTMTDGGGESTRRRVAALELDRLRIQRDETDRRIRLELETSARRARVALATLASARERVEEARTAFRLVRRRQAEGLAAPLEFYDARATLTRARLGLGIAETDALIRLSELDHAAGGPVPPLRRAESEEDR